MSVRRHVIMLTVTVVVIVGTFVATLLSDNRPVLGLDLQGGVSVVLVPEDGQDLAALDTATEIIRSRVDALGIAEPEVSRQGDTIVIDLPGVKERDRALELVGQTAELRFRLAQGQLPFDTPIPATTTTTAPPAGATTTTGAGATTTTGAGATTTTGAAVTPGSSVEGSSAGTRIEATPVAAVRPAQQDATTIAPTTPTTIAPTATTPTAVTAPTTTLPFATGDTCADLLTPREEITDAGDIWLPDRERTSCTLVGPTLLTGEALSTASAQYDETGGGWVVGVTFRNDDFVNLVAQPYVGQQVAIELDGVVQSAPTINEGITGREVQITGQFTQGEAKDLALVLKYGALPIQFDESEQTVQSVSPSLGKDQLRAGIVAGLIGLGLVALYMILYYRLLGLVVWVGLALTGMVFFTLVSYLSSSRGLTLTLAGVTGLIVSVGVTVDSYVVYFERLKDEVRMGKTIRSSLDSGFRRSFRTILAADLVSLLGAAVLYALAAGSVRGFAFFLGLSTVIDLLIAYLVMHPLVSLMARRPALIQMRNVGIAVALDVPGVRA